MQKRSLWRARRDYDAALAHFAAMLPCPRSPPHWQAHYLRQFLEAVTQAAAAKVLCSLGVYMLFASPWCPPTFACPAARVQVVDQN